MHSPFDILKKKPEGSFCRFEGVNDLANARTMSLLSADQVSGSMPEGSDHYGQATGVKHETRQANGVSLQRRSHH
jgi:hypothetical protein